MCNFHLLMRIYGVFSPLIIPIRLHTLWRRILVTCVKMIVQAMCG
ncbi:hypothetical protein Hanom_Chr08g00737761 [Helianthus anomalus]